MTKADLIAALADVPATADVFFEDGGAALHSIEKVMVVEDQGPNDPAFVVLQ